MQGFLDWLVKWARQSMIKRIACTLIYWGVWAFWIALAYYILVGE